MSITIFGLHSCKAAIISGKRNISKIYLQNGKDIPDWIVDFKNIIRIDEQSFKKLLPKKAVHQGIAITLNDESSYYSDITDLLSVEKKCSIAILDGVTDPHNFGAIIRSAATFGIKCIIIPERSSCRINGTVAKAASGGLEHTSICIVKNLASTIDRLKEYGFWIVALDENGNKYIGEIDLNDKICLVLGAEGNGIRRLQKEKVDFIVKLPTNSKFSTLNVSNAAAIAFYELARQKL